MNNQEKHFALKQALKYHKRSRYLLALINYQPERASEQLLNDFAKEVWHLLYWKIMYKTAMQEARVEQSGRRLTTTDLMRYVWAQINAQQRDKRNHLIITLNIPAPKLFPLKR